MENIEEAYQRTLDYLYSFVDYSLTRSLRYSPEKFDLGRMHRFVEMLGSPHAQYPIVHVAGTKGKGSTSAMIAEVLQTAGYKVGLYTSPHMIDFSERIQVNRVPVSHKELVDLVEKLKPAVEVIEQLTTFELTTAAAFLYFAQEKVDIAVIEVGLGGRLDATNVVDPLVSVITSLSMDHMNVLGDTLEKIAAEKGGIIKPGKPVIVAHQKPEAISVLRKIAMERHSPMTYVDDAWTVDSIAHTLQGQTIEIKALMDRSEPIQFSLSLHGEHQAHNALTAFCVLDFLRHKGYKFNVEQIQKGFAKVVWPGRFEILQTNPMVIIDSAHNIDSCEKLAQTVRDYLPGRDVILIFGASEDKEVKGMLQALAPIAGRALITQSIHPRSFDPLALTEIARDYFKQVEAAVPLEEAVKKAIDQIDKGGVILITGSIFVAAGARQYLIG